MKTLLLRAAAIASPLFAAALFVIPVHAAPFAMYAPTPTSAFRNVSTEYRADYESSGPNINRCVLAVDTVTQGTMTITGTPHLGTAKLNATISTNGSHVVLVTCYDDTAGISNYNESTVTVTSDTTGPTVSSFVLMPVAPTAGASFTLQTNYDDTAGSGMNTCGLIVDGAEAGLLALSGGVGSTTGTATFTGSVATSGTHTLTINCFDRATNLGTRSQVVTFAAATDITPPTVSAVTPTTGIQGSNQNYSVTFSDANTVNNCTLYVQQVGGSYNTYTMSRSGTNSGSASYSYGISTAVAPGNYNMYATCTDSSGNIGTGATTAVNFTVSSSTDTTAPVVSSINPSSVAVGASAIISASYSDSIGVTSCSLYVNGAIIGGMDRSGNTAGTATHSYTFGTSGNYTVEVRCSDSFGNVGTASRTITANTSGPYANRLVKLMCPAGVLDVNHPCKAVYFVTADGARHAFPNERIYFTWYSNFDGVVELSSLSSFSLGNNVTYRPGFKLVKFTTLDHVYAVGRNGLLRWITTEAAARALYGTNWNHQIDDISDAFFVNYHFGADINSSADFSPSAEAAAASTVDANF